MMFRSRCRWSRCLEFGAAALLAAAAVPVRACGPDFPNSYLGASDAALLAAPEGFFDEELARLAGATVTTIRAAEANLGDFESRRRRVENGELTVALVAGGCSPAEARERAQAFETWRSELDAWRRVDCIIGPDGIMKTVPPQPVAPAGVPEEFALYATGAAAWKSGDWTAAQEAWTALLALPEAQRRQRSVVTAYMFGRSAGLDVSGPSTRAPAEALAETRRWFQLTRDLATRGLPDPFGLAAESYGWEARAALDHGEVETAVNLYLQQLATGDATAKSSLRIVAAQLVMEGVTADVVRDPAARQVVLAYLVSRVGSSIFDDEAQPPFARWAAELATAIEQAGLADIASADRLAWLAYQGGQFELAARWAKLAPETAVMASWIRAKLALRAGELAEGARLLGLVVAEESGDGMRGQAAAELGRVRLALGDFPGTLAAWLRGGHWTDAAYVAERLMTTAELEAFVASAAMPPPLPDEPKEEPQLYRRAGWWGSGALGENLRHLLARRLARAGQVEEAEPYFPQKLRAVARRYGQDVRTGFDPARPTAARAAAFWRAAQTAREYGLELLGTELEPDWYIWGAEYQTEEAGEMRRAAAQKPSGFFAPAEAELARLKEHGVPERRFHYRYRAAELAGWAAGLLPNDSPEAAEMLNAAGCWLAARDPQAAKPFYQLLVIRCANTELGRRAAAAHWFPSTERDASEKD